MRWVIGGVVFVVACSGSTVMKPEELESEWKQLRSLEAEVRLLENVIRQGHSTTPFSRGHARALHKAAEEHVTLLARKRPPEGQDAQFRRVQAGFDSLVQRVQ